MLNKTLFLIIFLLFACATCFAQTTFMGITPGKSTKPDVERVFGQPVSSVSKTLIEYKDTSPQGASKIYLQYRDDAPFATVERLELICSRAARCEFTGDFFNRTKGHLPIFRKVSTVDGYRQVTFYDIPIFVVETLIGDAAVAQGSRQASERRVAIYSKELFYSAIPKTGCTGMILGVWDTIHGRMTITKVGDNIAGTYTKGNGTFTLTRGWSRGKRWSYNGDWKDDTGAGAMYLEFPSNADDAANDSFTGEWWRGHIAAEIKDMSPRPSGEPWSGKCVP